MDCHVPINEKWPLSDDFTTRACVVYIYILTKEYYMLLAPSFLVKNLLRHINQGMARSRKKVNDTNLLPYANDWRNEALGDFKCCKNLNDRFQFHEYFIVLFCSYMEIKELLITAVLFCKTDTVSYILTVVFTVISDTLSCIYFCIRNM